MDGTHTKYRNDKILGKNSMSGDLVCSEIPAMTCQGTVRGVSRIYSGRYIVSESEHVCILCIVL